MRPINIYALTRIEKMTALQQMERQMSGRRHFLKIKKWEVLGLTGLVKHLVDGMVGVEEMSFFYSYQIPKLGKEFDLIRISDDKIINIELKSEVVSDEKIKKQLIQNRYYLNTLGRTVRSYTYISSTDRLVRLTKGERLVDADWDTLCDDIHEQTDCYIGNIEDIIREEEYIISPFSEPDRFLNREYFLTSQQKDIAYHILKKISEGGYSIQGFTGAPGTGKTLLLYDIAMALTVKQRVAVFHCGSFSDELKQLDDRLKRIDFYDGAVDSKLPDLEGYSGILVDEAHRASSAILKQIMEYANHRGMPVVFSYDCEDAIADKELSETGIRNIVKSDDYVGYRLTNRIRTNAELSSFVHCLVHPDKGNHRKDYPNVSVFYANDSVEKQALIQSLINSGYIYVYETKEAPAYDKVGVISPSEAASREFDSVVMVMDEELYYHDNYLRVKESGKKGRVVELFHSLSRGKEKLAIVVVNNEAVFDTLLGIVQSVR